MKNLLLLITLLTSTITFSQTEDRPLTIVEQMPQYVGGQKKMSKFIQKNIQYPKDAYKAKIGGTCYITFIVEKDGAASNVQVLRGGKNCTSCDDEAVRVVLDYVARHMLAIASETSRPNWEPGKQNGREVRVQYNLPIKFIP